MHLNIQCITNKSQALQRLAEQNNIDVICLSEHWLTLNNQNLYNLSGYKCIWYIRKEHIHGGVGVLCKENMTAIDVNDGISDLSIEMDFECAAIYIPDSNIIIISTYRSGLGNFETFLTRINQVLTHIMKHFPADINIIICGDFNVQFAKNSQRAQEVVNTLKTFDLHPTIFHSTRNNSTIDNIFTNLKDFIIEQISGNISDHEPQILKVLLKDQVHQSKRRYHRVLTRSTKISLVNALKEEKWAEVYAAEDPNDMYRVSILAR